MSRALLIALLLAAVYARVLLPIDPFTQSQMLSASAIRGDSKGLNEVDPTWYSPYYNEVGGGYPPGASFADGASILGGQRDIILGYYSNSDPVNSSIYTYGTVNPPDSPLLVVSLNRKWIGGAYLQWDGVDAVRSGLIAPIFPGAQLNRFPGIGVTGTGDTPDAPGFDFTFGGRGSGFSMKAPQVLNYFIDVLDGGTEENHLKFVLDPHLALQYIRFDAPGWSNPSFNWTDVAAFQIRIWSYDPGDLFLQEKALGLDYGILTSISSLSLVGYEISGFVGADCGCDGTIEIFQQDQSVVLYNLATNPATVVARTVTDSEGYFLFDGTQGDLNDGDYTVCLEDTARTFCSGSACHNFTLVNLVDATELNLTVSCGGGCTWITEDLATSNMTVCNPGLISSGVTDWNSAYTYNPFGAILEAAEEGSFYPTPFVPQCVASEGNVSASRSAVIYYPGATGTQTVNCSSILYDPSPASGCSFPEFTNDITFPERSLSGNQFWPGQGDHSQGSATFTVGFTSQGTSIAVGDTVLIAQMQGADFDSTSETPSPSGVLAGASEYGQVIQGGATSRGGTFTIATGSTYGYVSRSASETKSVARWQVVKVITAHRIRIPRDAVVWTLPWDGTCGGISAFQTSREDGEFEVNGILDASGSGFRGGYGLSSADPDLSCSNPGEGYLGSPQQAYRRATGPSVGPNTYFLTTAGRPYGSAGGYGGGENGGGGGGSNGPTGVGGNGGASGGTGGVALPDGMKFRPMLGGGGGSGQHNNGSSDYWVHSGQAGGGAIFVRAGKIFGSGIIRADGEHTPASCNSHSACFQSANAGGGAGAGGSISLQATVSIYGSLTLSVRGGSGGSSDDPFAGGGGGGSSGVVGLFCGGSIWGTTVRTDIGIGGSSLVPATNGTANAVVSWAGMNPNCTAHSVLILDVCPKGQFTDINSCVPCSSGCLDCSGSGSSLSPLGPCNACELMDLLGTVCLPLAAGCPNSQIVNVDSLPRCAMAIDPITADGVINIEESTSLTISGTGAPENTTTTSITVTISSENSESLNFTAVNFGNGSWLVSQVDVSSILITGMVTVSSSARDIASGAVSLTSTITAMADVSPPAVEVVHPADNSHIIDSEVVVAGSSVDAILVNVTISMGSLSQTKDTSPQEDGGWNVSFSTDSLSPGNWTVTATAMDSAGNMAYGALSHFIFETTPLFVTISSPIAGDDIVNVEESSHVIVSGTSSLGNTTLSVVAMSSNGVPVKDVYVYDGAFDGSWSFDISMDAYADGQVTLQAATTDSIFRVVTAAHYVLLARTPPTILLDRVTADDTINNQEQFSVAFTGKVTETTLPAVPLVSLMVSSYDGAIVEATAPLVNGFFILTSDLSHMPDGLLDVEAQVSDLGGNVATTSTMISKYTVGAAVTIDTVAGDDIINRLEATSLTISGTGYNGNVVHVRLNDSESTVLESQSVTVVDHRYTVSLGQVLSLADGAGTVTAIATDSVGNLASASRSVTIQITPPTGLEIDVPISGDGYVNAAEIYLVSFSGKASPEASVVRLAIMDDSTSFLVTFQSDPILPSGEWKATTSLNGLSSTAINGARVSAVQQDFVGNIQEAYARFTIDTEPPILNMVSPTQNEVVNTANVSAVPIKGFGEDGLTITLSASVGVSSYSLSTCEVSSGVWSVLGDLGALPDGVVILTSSETDAAGNLVNVRRNIIKDTLPPVVTVDTVAGDDIVEELESLVALTGTIEGGDSAGQAVDVIITFSDSSTAILSTIESYGTWKLVVNLNGRPQGKAVIHVSVSDIHGNMGSVDHLILLNLSPASHVLFWLSFIVVSAAITVVLLTVIVIELCWKWRRRMQSPSVSSKL